ncbi:DRTGG domain-containing protein [Natranaerovirga pectinivora]|uniref:DRTGG domain-containing protein n=1 Tax=Natranaerovirga pectinivora TaxID=682400 RepID=A0A4R3MPR9_9FIRM|nr:DRTGG domain-containing protein [Natranaerovirga pectinivora]TCT14982.1 DRTGG domain-containing protein [Natranaerovirga pectinivora]
MTVKELIEKLSLKIVAGEEGINKEVKGGFTGDLLSVVMGNAKEGQVWVTIQSHINIVAVAVLTNIACIIVTEGFEIDQDAIIKANEEDISILVSNKSSYDMIKELIEIGIG